MVWVRQSSLRKQFLVAGWKIKIQDQLETGAVVRFPVSRNLDPITARFKRGFMFLGTDLANLRIIAPEVTSINDFWTGWFMPQGDLGWLNSC